VCGEEDVRVKGEDLVRGRGSILHSPYES
jgi:hypothetical protein